MILTTTVKERTDMDAFSVRAAHDRNVLIYKPGFMLVYDWVMD